MNDLAASMNSLIYVVDLRLYNFDLNQNLLYKVVFKNLFWLFLNGIIHSIDGNIFKSFNNLKILELKVENTRKFFQKNNKWL